MSRPKVRAAEAVDREALVAFLAGFPGETRSADSWRARLRHFWEENPISGPWGWALERADGTIGGFRGLIPYAFWLDGAAVHGVSGTTWRIAEDCRGWETALLLQHRRLKLAGPLVATTPAKHVRPIIERLGYTPLAPQGLRRLSVVPMAPLAARAWLKPLARLVARVPRPGFGWRAAQARAVGFGALWQRTANLAGFTRSRDTDSARWFVGERPLLVLGPLDDPQAYAVFEPGTLRGAPILRLMDYWPPPTDPAPVRRLIAALLADPFGGQYAAALLHHPSPAFTEALSGLPVPTRAVEPPGMYALALGQPLPEAGRWFTLGEGDHNR